MEKWHDFTKNVVNNSNLTSQTYFNLFYNAGEFYCWFVCRFGDVWTGDFYKAVIGGNIEFGKV